MEMVVKKGMIMNLNFYGYFIGWLSELLYSLVLFEFGKTLQLCVTNKKLNVITK